VPTSQPSFFNWQHDDQAIAAALGWPLHGLLFDVEHNELWLPSWGARPATAETRAMVVQRLLAAAPPLIPVFGHRYLLAEPLQAGNPVLSVDQSDIIIYGDDLRAYLLCELGDLLGLDTRWHSGIQSTAIRFWGEIMSA
jgi:hypothetical protein